MAEVVQAKPQRGSGKGVEEVMNAFGNWQEHQVAEHNQKVAQAKLRTAKAHNLIEGVGEVEIIGKAPDKLSVKPRESDLHDEILAECRRRGWAVVHSRMDKRATLTPGAPDFIIGADGGRTFWIEVKRPGGKLRPAQRDFAYLLSKNQHEPFLVTTWEEFLEVIRI